jgi:hypothetical protein
MEKVRRCFIAAMHFLELCHFTLHMLMMFIAENTWQLLRLFFITILRKLQKMFGGCYKFFKQPIDRRKCLLTNRCLLDGQSNKTLNGYQAFF